MAPARERPGRRPVRADLPQLDAAPSSKRPAVPRARTLLPTVVMPLLLFAVLARGAAGGGFRWDAALLRLAEDWYHVDPAVEISRAAAKATTVLVAAVGVATLAVLITRRRLRESAFCGP